MTNRCDAHVLLGPASLTSDHRDWIADCILNAGHPESHRGPLDHAVATDEGGWNTPEIVWLEDDRRTYHGDYSGVCGGDTPSAIATAPCVLPAGHPRGHAS